MTDPCGASQADFETTQGLPPMEGSRMISLVKWSDLGVLWLWLQKGPSLNKLPVTIYCSLYLSLNHYHPIISDMATCPSFMLVPYWQMNSLRPRAHWSRDFRPGGGWRNISHALILLDSFLTHIIAHQPMRNTKGACTWHSQNYSSRLAIMFRCHS